MIISIDITTGRGREVNRIREINHEGQDVTLHLNRAGARS